MDAVRHWFQTNQVVVLGLYGQVFVAMGIAIAMQSRKHTQLQFGQHLPWLAAFGLSHGLVEWGFIFIPIQAAYLSPAGVELLRDVQLGLLLFSFICLIHFGFSTAIRTGPLSQPAAIWTLVAILTTISAAVGFHPSDGPVDRTLGIEIWSCYLMAAPGAAAGALGILRGAEEARHLQFPHIARWLRFSAVALAAYSLLVLITPEHHGLLAPWINYRMVLDLVGIPAELWRALVVAAVLVGILRSLSIFDIEIGRRLRDVEQRRLVELERELTCMNQIAASLGRTPDPLDAVQAVLPPVLTLLEATAGQIALPPDEGTPEWRVAAREGPGSGPQDRAEEHFSSVIQEVGLTGKLAFRQLDATQHAIAFPISLGDKIIAVAAVLQERPFRISTREFGLIDNLGGLLGLLLENHRLWAELRRKEADRTRWISRILSAQEEERRRIGLELHDDAVQRLVLLCRRLDGLQENHPSLPATACQEIDRIRKHTEELISSLRDFARGLRPPSLDDLGVVVSLTNLISDLQDRTGIIGRFKVIGKQRPLSSDREEGLFRIAQEAIRNAENHAEARTVHVEMGYGPERVTLRVVDDGRGMPPKLMRSGMGASGRLGLLGIQERAALMDGEFQLHSRPGRGTEISVSIPLVASRAEGL